MWKLVIEDDEGKRTVVPLTRDHYSIGRKEGNTIRLTERNVSRDHARLHKKNGGGLGEKPTFVLEDLTSYNGVFVNGLRVGQAQDLAHGDLVQIGDYRIVLQDEILADAQEVETGESKQTIPSAPNARAAALMDRPNRLVMLTGPAPGSEFPLERDRLSIGRAEDATISVNHNSVSRMHCEVHALGDGRFEIVDKGSSNGVRVNGAELRRGIIESGDLIELGDVKFKFIGAGQIFRATESQQLAAMTDRVARDIAGPPRSSNALPVAAFIVVVVAGAAGAWVYTRPPMDTPPAPTVAVVSPDRATLDRAKKLCAAGDCETAHTIIASIPEASPLRSTQEFKDIESKWADDLLARASREADIATKKDLYQRVAQAITVEPTRRKAGADRLQELDVVAVAATNAADLPAASSGRVADDNPPPPPAPARESRRAAAIVDPPPLPPVLAAPNATPPSAASPSPTKSTAPSVDDRERQLALQGTQDAKMLLKQQLEQRVSSGKATDTEIRLLISTCKDLGDRPCVQQARAVQAQRGN
ncbi:MAG TPA: FHA domain-containing protein [Polyangiaceae bacterium]|jgi:pSer/pThr/pTyr-binding forkhead associated (FHA) protein